MLIVSLVPLETNSWTAGDGQSLFGCGGLANTTALTEKTAVYTAVLLSVQGKVRLTLAWPSATTIFSSTEPAAYRYGGPPPCRPRGGEAALS